MYRHWLIPSESTQFDRSDVPVDLTIKVLQFSRLSPSPVYYAPVTRRGRTKPWLDIFLPNREGRWREGEKSWECRIAASAWHRARIKSAIIPPLLYTSTDICMYTYTEDAQLP